MYLKDPAKNQTRRRTKHRYINTLKIRGYWPPTQKVGKKKKSRKVGISRLKPQPVCHHDFQEWRLHKKTCFGHAGMDDFYCNLPDPLWLRNKERRIEIMGFPKNIFSYIHGRPWPLMVDLKSQEIDRVLLNLSVRSLKNKWK